MGRSIRVDRAGSIHVAGVWGVSQEYQRYHLQHSCRGWHWCCSEQKQCVCVSLCALSGLTIAGSLILGIKETQGMPTLVPF